MNLYDSRGSRCKNAEDAAELVPEACQNPTLQAAFLASYDQMGREFLAGTEPAGLLCVAQWEDVHTHFHPTFFFDTRNSKSFWGQVSLDNL